MRDHVGNIVVVSTDEEERCKRLHEAFFTQLQGWLGATTQTVRPSPGASRALALALQETAAIVVMATQAPELESDEATGARAQAAADEAFAVLERHAKPGRFNR